MFIKMGILLQKLPFIKFLIVEKESAVVRGKDTESIDKEMETLDEEIEKYKETLTVKCVCAYVTFCDRKDREKMLRDYPDKW